MNASILDLRRRMAEVIRALDRGETVTILYRGKPKGILTPVKSEQKPLKSVTEDPAFGMWKDREDMRDVEAYVRRMRRGRRHAL